MRYVRYLAMTNHDNEKNEKIWNAMSDYQRPQCHHFFGFEEAAIGPLHPHLPVGQEFWHLAIWDEHHQVNVTK